MESDEKKQQTPAPEGQKPEAEVQDSSASEEESKKADEIWEALIKEGKVTEYEKEDSKSGEKKTFQRHDVLVINNIPAGFQKKFLLFEAQEDGTGILYTVRGKPLTKAQKAKREAERKAEAVQMKAIKDNVKDQFKTCEREYRKEVQRAMSERRPPSEAVLKRLKDAEKKWKAIKGEMTLEKTQEALNKFVA